MKRCNSSSCDQGLVNRLICCWCKSLIRSPERNSGINLAAEQSKNHSIAISIMLILNHLQELAAASPCKHLYTRQAALNHSYTGRRIAASSHRECAGREDVPGSCQGLTKRFVPKDSSHLSAARTAASKFVYSAFEIVGSLISGRKDWRRGPGSNRRIKVLQTSPLPLGYRALAGLPDFPDRSKPP